MEVAARISTSQSWDSGTHVTLPILSPSGWGTGVQVGYETQKINALSPMNTTHTEVPKSPRQVPNVCHLFKPRKRWWILNPACWPSSPDSPNHTATSAPSTYTHHNAGFQWLQGFVYHCGWFVLVSKVRILNVACTKARATLVLWDVNTPRYK